MIVVPGWKIFNIPPSSNIIHDTVLYYGMWCLLPNEWCINQGSGYLILLFFYQLFSVDAMRFIFMNIVLLIYWTFYINQPMICYFCVCYLGGIVGDVYVANFFLITVSIHQWLPHVWNITRTGYFWALEFIQGIFNIPSNWVLYWYLLVVLFRNYSHI